MSMKVEMADLAAAVDAAGPAFLVTIADDGRARVLAVATSCVGAEITTSDAGRGAPANIERRPDVTLIYPPTEPGGMSLLVDGRGRVEGPSVVVTAQQAVRHRPAPTTVG